MSTRIYASTVIEQPMDRVWGQLRDFTFPKKMFSKVAAVEMEGDAKPATVGGVRKVTWKGGETTRARLVGLNDQESQVMWELMPKAHGEDETPYPYSAAVTTVQLWRITETGHTFATWTVSFSADITGPTLQHEQKEAEQNLHQIRDWFTRNK